MKILFTLLMLVLLQCSFAQDEISCGNEGNSKHDYYVMEGDYIIHYYTEVKSDTIFNNMALRKGNVLTSSAELVDKKGKIIFLNEGECVDSKGNISDCAKLKKKLEGDRIGLNSK